MTNLLETRNLSFAYPDGTSALEGINFYVRQGEFVGVLGANGSGKTTLLRMLNGLLKAKKGDVSLEGKDIKSISRDVLFSKVCTMFQNPDDQLFAPTVSQDVSFGPVNLGLSSGEVQKRVQEALASVGMSECRERPIHTLSFGQKKRICLAGVLAMNPEVILLDEPTASLDPMGESSIMHLFKKLNREKGVTLVMATHAVDLVPLFIDRLVILNKGQILSEGPPELVFSDSAMIRQAKLRLPRIGHLFEILRKRDDLNLDHLPLTIGEARRELLNKVNN